MAPVPLFEKSKTDTFIKITGAISIKYTVI
jgi:hypothetical protein